MLRKKLQLTRILWFVIVTVLLLAESTFADIYKYTDDTGSVCMTNRLESVPKRYRSKMTVLKEESPKVEKVLPEMPKNDTVQTGNTAVKDSQEQDAVSKGQVDNKSRYIRTALTVAVIFSSFYVLRWFGNISGIRGVGTALFLLTIAVGGVYLYRMYIIELSAVFATLRNDVMNIKKNVETRENKTDQMLKLKEENEAKE